VRNPTVNGPPAAAPENTAAAAAAATQEEATRQKYMLGENLYPRISVALQALKQEALAGKITGMLLDSMTPEELYGLIESPDALNRKISEALEVLENYNKSKENAAATPAPATETAAAPAAEVSNNA